MLLPENAALPVAAMIDISAPRYVEEWIGKTPDTPVPARVKLRRYIHQKGICAVCSRALRPNHWDADHIVALINGGENVESNLRAVCDTPCHREKTRADVAEKAKTYRKRCRHLGIKQRTSRPMPGSRDSKWKHTMSGQWVRREETNQ